MSAILILTPLIIGGSWPAITAAAAGAAVALGLTVRTTAKEGLAVAEEDTVRNSVEVEVKNSEILQSVATEQQIVLQAQGGVEVTVKRDARGRCVVCASGRGKTKAELKALAEQFTERMTQCFVYNRVMTELKAKGFQVMSEERAKDETVNIRVRRWEG
jgi:translation initiation factor 1 (eIF-1/SUI1)